MTFGKQVLSFYKNLDKPDNLPDEVEVLHPFSEQDVMNTIETFYKKFFDDDNKRTFLIGINPGRFGGGVTGIPFTDPIRLEEKLGIENDFDKKPELSSRFLYQVIDALGGPSDFFNYFYITSVSPLGFTKDGKNLNYYDIKELRDVLEDYIVDNMRKQIKFGARPVAYSLGKGQNIKYLKQLNKKHELFEEIKPLPHPRWVMQYRLKRIDEFIGEYKEALANKMKKSDG